MPTASLDLTLPAATPASATPASATAAPAAAAPAAPAAPESPVGAPRPRRVSPGTGFWLGAATFLVVMAYTTVPTTLWSLYQQRDGFSTFAITIAFAAYAAGVVVSLFLAGHLGDTLGRRTLLVPAIALELASAAVFLLWPDLPGLIVARVISGLGIGMATATMTAHLLDLHLGSRPGASPVRGQIVSGMANLGGFGVGAVVAGMLAEWAPAPLTTPFLVFVVLLVLALVAVLVVPETARIAQPREPYRPQRVRVPVAARGRFLLAAGTAFAGFAILGLFTSLVPSFVAGELHIASRAVAGAVVFSAFAAAALAQVAVRPLGMRAQVGLGVVLFVAGVATLTTVVAVSGPLAGFLVGGIVGGAGSGVLFKAALAVAGSLADAAHRGEVLAGIFLAGYIGLTIPVVGLGVATLSVSLVAALTGFAIVIGAIAVAAGIPLIVALGQAARGDSATS